MAACLNTFLIAHLTGAEHDFKPPDARRSGESRPFALAWPARSGPRPGPSSALCQAPARLQATGRGASTRRLAAPRPSCGRDVT